MLVQVLFNGLALGSIYGLVALGFCLIFKATEVFNFAQGILVACGAYLLVSAIQHMGLPFPVGIAFTLLAAAALGGVIHTLLIRPIAGSSMLSLIMMTMALSITLRALLEIIYGPSGYTLSTPLPRGAYVIAGVRLSGLHLSAAVVSVLCMIGFALFFKFTSTGLLMRATADNPEAATIAGVNVSRMNRLAWAIGSGLAAIGGIFLGQLQLASIELEAVGLLALPAVVIGGMQSLPGAIVGGLLVGIIEQLAASYISPRVSDVLIYVILLLFLLIRPWGLFGQRELGRV